MSVQILIGDCMERMRELPDASVDSVVCDPPYHLTNITRPDQGEKATPYNRRNTHIPKAGFMGQTWDGGDVAFRPETWAEVLRVLKPGGHLVAFGGTRTFHRLACAIEDAGFEIRDMIAWHYASGFPKSHDISKAIDRTAGAEREIVGPNPFNKLRGISTTEGTLTAPQAPSNITAPATDEARKWEGYGTALKPATEPICLARKPLSEKSIAANVLRWGTGGLNIDATRIPFTSDADKDGWRYRAAGKDNASDLSWKNTSKQIVQNDAAGRWPANLCHDGSDEVLAGFPADIPPSARAARTGNDTSGWGLADNGEPFGYTDSGSAARFFMQAKYSEEELLFHHAKAMVSTWNQEIANTAESSLALANQAAAFALSGVVTWAAQGVCGQTQIKYFQGLSTSATPTELKTLCESAIAAILISASEFLPEWQHIKPTPIGSRVQCAEMLAPTDTTMITISHWKSNGFAEPVTFSITRKNSEHGEADLGTAKRFHYTAKASSDERGEGNNHPTVKPFALMCWLCRLVTPKGGTVLDPFCGSGSTLIAADAEQFNAIGCELSPEYAAIAERRVRDAAGMFADVKVAA